MFNTVLIIIGCMIVGFFINHAFYRICFVKVYQKKCFFVQSIEKKAFTVEYKLTYTMSWYIKYIQLS